MDISDGCAKCYTPERILNALCNFIFNLEHRATITGRDGYLRNYKMEASGGTIDRRPRIPLRSMRATCYFREPLKAGYGPCHGLAVAGWGSRAPSGRSIASRLPACLAARRFVPSGSPRALRCRSRVICATVA